MFLLENEGIFPDANRKDPVKCFEGHIFFKGNTVKPVTRGHTKGNVCKKGGFFMQAESNAENMSFIHFIHPAFSVSIQPCSKSGHFREVLL
jgi:hypothetical protein